MKYEFHGKSLADTISKAVAKQPARRLATKGSDSDSATIWGGGQARLQLTVKPEEYYTVEWEARTSADGNDYSIDIFTDSGFGTHSETFSDGGSWRFYTGGYEGQVSIIVGFTYAYSVLRRCDVWVG